MAGLPAASSSAGDPENEEAGAEDGTPAQASLQASSGGQAMQLPANTLPDAPAAAQQGSQDADDIIG